MGRESSRTVARAERATHLETRYNSEHRGDPGLRQHHRRFPQAAWDALLDGQRDAVPALAWLEALETSGCATGATGWQPCHLTLWRGKELVAAAPAYIKEDSDGDFSRDWGWARRRRARRIAYYPKLVADGAVHAVHRAARAGARGRRSRRSAPQLLVGGARRASPSEAGALVGARAVSAAGRGASSSRRPGWRGASRISITGATPATPRFDEFLARFDSKKRNQAKRERARWRSRASRIRTLRDAELRAAAEALGRRRLRAASLDGRQADVGTALDQPRLLSARRRAHARAARAGRRRAAGRRQAGRRRVQRGLENASLRSLLGLLRGITASYISTCACITRSTSASAAACRSSKAAPAASTRSRAASSRRRPSARTCSSTRGSTSPIRDYIAREAEERARALGALARSTPRS